MFKEWLKQFLAMCICVITVLSSFSTAFADDYVKSDSGDDATYYIIDGKDINTLFDFGIWDVDDIASWIFQFKTFTVIKKYEDVDNNEQYKMYFNTPNLQSIVKNRVISLVSDGYTDDTYKVEDTEWVVKVGKNADAENVITKYGFSIPSYTYMGEYPKEVMSTAGILPSPKKWWQVAWRAIKSLFGASFIAAPNADNFNTITYMNHEYKDKDDYILDFFKLYYLDYFERQIPLDYVYADDNDKEGEYFSGPDEVISMAVTEDAYNAAVNYNNTHSDEYKEAVARYDYWNAYQSGGIDACLALTTQVGNKKFDSYHFLASIPKYQTQFENYVYAHTNVAYVLCKAIQGSHSRYGGSGSAISAPGGYNITPTSYSPNADNYTSVSLAADIMRYSDDGLKAKISYDIETRTTTTTTSSSGTTEETTDWTVTESNIEETVSFADTVAWRDGPADYTSDYSSTTSSHTETNEDGDDDDDNNTTTTTTTVTETRRCHYNIIWLQPGDDTSNTITYDEYKDFHNVCDFGSITYTEDDFVPANLQGVYNAYQQNADLIDRYERFIAMLGRGDDQDDATSKKEVLYRQCMITNESENEEECWSRKYGDDKTSLTVVQVYAYSRIYTVTQDYSSSTHELTDADAHEIISKLQAYCGPYYSEVLANMIKIMCATAKYENNNLLTRTVIADDYRVMPYDTATLLARDRQNYAVTDPRVELYKTHVVGKLISKFQLNPLAIGIFFKPQKTIVAIAGKVTEFSVFMQQLCNFDVLDGYGLSPTNMWTSAYVALMLGLLAMFFIVKTVVAIIKMGTNAGARLIVAFFILVFELGLVTAVSLDPERVWSTVKNVTSKTINLGEMATVYSTSGLEYLYGGSTDMEVTYYMPYLDTWSKYNTGYGILDSEQTIDDTRDAKELMGADLPKIDGTKVKHWSVLLMDSFHYWGYSNSIANTITEGGHTYNGPVINNNAYRVVDHFMAPRVDITDQSDSIKMNVKMNENYNGEFQTGMVDIIVKLLNCFLCCLLSLIKLMTFLYLWFMLYIFIFKVILGRGAENKTMSRILIETFSPLIAMIMIGLYTGIIMQMGMNASGLIGICLEIFLFWLTFMMIRWWHDLGHGMFFPLTLGWMYMITNLSASNRRRQQDRLKNESEQTAIDADMGRGWADKSLEEQRDELFESGGGRLKDKYRNDPKYKKVVNNWYERANRRQANPTGSNYLDDDTRRAMRNLEGDDKFRDDAKKISYAVQNKQRVNYDKDGNITNGADSDKASNGKIGSKSGNESADRKSKVNDMYGNSTSVNSDKSAEPTNKPDENADDYGRSATGSGKSGKERRQGPKKIGQSDNNDSKGDMTDE